ncbi:DUF3108 domain-containing protein [Bradyrhizobium sp. AUGA SZCCT0240]|uniref:DUF3108 domain-containing protein n=1 Tax=unclassified Bradyrhizobium TaxID=2631580 RepID=UPI001BA73910|nr:MULTISPECIES: DUF3108 domain-containing protein [unclassified Bradyrhizobium]MBR1195693.1 DUF3108 domain-containing protein [Bradyrhizobium sp. AUGA SZCCT0158]MBR1242660.1 DUF3108 domain-containing protein [Bradyrhizobium sp. AUGA SZCCT0274]MBR1252465.1 DUF3108 domain-containing protein [Bradyrhizobium sp. AUGA SZCCT0240]
MGSLAAGALLWLAPLEASAQGRLDAHYEASLAGIPVGKGTWTIEIGDDAFSASAQGGSTGLLQAFSGGKGSGASQGRVVGGALVANAYTATTTSSKKSETIRLSIANGGVKDFTIDPEPPVDPDRIVVTEAHRKNVLDPMTGAMIRVPGTGDPLSPEACRTGTGIFDGRLRYDLKLDYKRMENVKAERGYHGPAVVCAVYFTPIAGYIPDRPVIKHLASQRNIEIAFVPIAGTRILVPFRMTIPTPFGPAMLEATSFVTTAAPPRVAKTQ